LDAARAAIAKATAGDAVVVAGKGHEVGQLINGVNHHFDDREEVRRALADNGYS
jgi:UDP-N-acetylmuramoyl-L-alanyl-D-glutamate--2,6-diaminopimelate ligase